MATKEKSETTEQNKKNTKALVKTDDKTQTGSQVGETLINEKTVRDFLFGSGTKLTEQQQIMFVQIATRAQLDPFKREIYAVAFKDRRTGEKRLSIITGYEVYLKRAERSGQLAGWKVWTEGDLDKNLKACIEISRKDWEKPLFHEVYFTEYCQQNKMWDTKPRTMIKKVAMAQGFRLAFPVAIGGIPYTADELPDESAKLPEIKKPQEIGEGEKAVKAQPKPQPPWVILCQKNKELGDMFKALKLKKKDGDTVWHNSRNAPPEERNALFAISIKELYDFRITAKAGTEIKTQTVEEANESEQPHMGD